MNSVSKWLLAGATLLIVQGMQAREHWGPPPACPYPKQDCCPKPKCEEPCAPKESKTTGRVFFKPTAKQKECPPQAECPKAECPQAACEPDPCCPPTCFERGLPTNTCCTHSAFNEPAAIELRCGAQTFITANFLYWEAMQGGMDLALPGEASAISPNVTSLTQSALGYNVLQQDFEYKPGFQVGLGWSGAKDDWVLYAEYTWLHGTTNTSATAPAPNVGTVNGISLPQQGVWIPTSWFSGIFSNNATTSITSQWNYKLDIVDAQISRPYYSGTRFLVEPFFGLRGAWFRQKMEMTALNLSTSGNPVPSSRRSANYSSQGNGVGPRIGVNGNWHLGYGLRFMGNAAASILFTGYDVKQNVQSPDSTGTNVFPLVTKLNDFNALRPNLDLSLGLGWGSYLCCQRFYVDLAATYDFSVFWQQNMMRYLADLTANSTSHPDGAASDLYLQGLTISTRFDF